MVRRKKEESGRKRRMINKYSSRGSRTFVSLSGGKSQKHFQKNNGKTGLFNLNEQSKKRNPLLGKRKGQVIPLKF